MNQSDIDAIAEWIVQNGLSGAAETVLLNGFCTRCENAGLPLSSAVAVIDTLHPIWEGRAFFWRNDGIEQDPMIEYGSSSSGEAAERWQKSAFHHLMQTGKSEVRRRIGFGDPTDFYSLD